MGNLLNKGKIKLFESAGDTNSASEITGSGTINTVAKFTAAQVIGNSSILDDGTYVSVGATNRLSIRVSDGRTVSGFLQSGLNATFSHVFCSTTPNPTDFAFCVSANGLATSMLLIYNNGSFEIGKLSSATSKFTGDGISSFKIEGDSVKQKLGINITPTVILDVLGTTEQLRLRYDAANYLSHTVSALGNVTYTNTIAATQTASTNLPNNTWAGSTKTWATGALATQYFNRFSANTAAFAAASTLAESYNVFIEATTAGTNATITNNFALGLTNGTYSIKMGQITGAAGSSAIYMLNSGTVVDTTNYILKSDGTDAHINAQQNTSLYIRNGNTAQIRIGAVFQTHTPGASTSGAVTPFTFTMPANTGQTASTEIPSFKVTGGSRQWAAGAIALQRENYFSTTTYTAVGASVITDAFGMYIEGPTASTNVTITNNWALGLNGGTLTTIGTGLMHVKQIVGTTDRVGIYFGTLTPDGANYALAASAAGGTITLLNGVSGSRIRANNTDIITVNAQNTIFTNVGTTGSVLLGFSFIQAANTNQVASTEASGFRFTGASRQWSTGAITTQRETYFSTTTYTAVGASVITSAYGLYVEKPTASTNVTINANYGIGTDGFINANASGSLGGYLINTNIALQQGVGSGVVTGGLTIGQGFSQYAFMPAGTVSGGNAVVPTYFMNFPTNTAITVATESPNVKWTGNTKQWAAGGGTLATQRDHWKTAFTYTALTNAMTITNAYGTYIEAPVASTNITITNNFALGVAGNVNIIGGGLRVSDKGIDTTAGDSATINSTTGRFRKDTTGTTFTLTNSYITANSIVILQYASDPGITGFDNIVVAGAGSATITFTTSGVAAAPTANTDMNFWVIN